MFKHLVYIPGSPGGYPVCQKECVRIFFRIRFVKIDGQWKIKRRELGTYAYVSREELVEE